MRIGSAHHMKSADEIYVDYRLEPIGAQLFRACGEIARISGNDNIDAAVAIRKGCQSVSDGLVVPYVNHVTERFTTADRRKSLHGRSHSLLVSARDAEQRSATSERFSDA